MIGKCPICDCHTDIESGGSEQSQCELCGIGIINISSTTPSFRIEKQQVYFCCDRCRVVYIREIANRSPCIGMLGKDRKTEGREIYDELIIEMVTDYIAQKYLKGCGKEINNGGEKDD